jgi:hypothetical protein
MPGRLSDRSLRLAVEVDRDASRLIAYAIKPQPFAAPGSTPAPRAYADGRSLQLEVVLLGPEESRFIQRLDVGRFCFEHAADTAPHVEGDVVVAHRDSLIVHVPDVAGSDYVELAYYEEYRGRATRRDLGRHRIDVSRFAAADGVVNHRDIVIADPDPSRSPLAPAGSTVIWPEDLDDPDIYRLYGDETQIYERIAIVIIPDGYTYGQKSLMEAHFDEMVSSLRGTTPYREHDNLLNYILVYAYSVESGTDQCDCNITSDTAMGSGFPEIVAQCGNSVNRCIRFSDCDDDGLGNAVLAELRAPAHSETVIMVNSSRYGGCSGTRVFYTTGHADSMDVVTHELGHLLGNLSDEYVTYGTCGSTAAEINTSLDATSGAWPEWISELGSPREGAQYYGSCIYRPETNCRMRNDAPFCRVCNQQWSLALFGHPDLSPIAPVATSSPGSPMILPLASSIDFSVTTRFSVGPGVSNSVTWAIQEQGAPGDPVVVATGAEEYSHLFDVAGDFTLTCEVVADTNFVKPEKYGSNRDTVIWQVCAGALAPDCNQNGIPDTCEADCNSDGIPEDCEPDCNQNGIADPCDLLGGFSSDCNANGVPDECDPDCNGSGNGIPDDCEPDCNDNGEADTCEIAEGTTYDCDADGLLDECEADCDADGVPDDCDLDCNENGIPDGCELHRDCNADGVPDECEPDCDENGVPDACEPVNDCDVDGEPDECQTQPSFVAQIISSTAALAKAVHAADLDGAGDLDVLSASSGDDKLAWYENIDGLGTFGAQQVISMQADGASSVFAADLDGDGDVDVLSGSTSYDWVAWYENTDGVGTFGPEQIISSSSDFVVAVLATDVDEDGDIDVLAASANDDKIVWYDNIGGSGAVWQERMISTDADNPRSIFAADLDGDGDTDVVSASALDHEVAWYDNSDGAGTFGPQQIISNSGSFPVSVFAADVDGDGDIDVFASLLGDAEIVWYRNTDGSGSFGPAQVVSGDIAAAAIVVVDLDGDGDGDVLSATGPEIAWFANTDGVGTFGSKRIVDSTVSGTQDVFATDIDGDTDLDVLSASSSDSRIAWYPNASDDCDGNGVPDTCEPDCNGNGITDACDIRVGASIDCNANRVPDECDTDCVSLCDADGDGCFDDSDGDPQDPAACDDTDRDGCDDCASGSFDPANDGLDSDGDGICDVLDCQPTNNTVWLDPGEVSGLRLFGSPSRTTLLWERSTIPGSTDVRFDTLRSAFSSDFTGATVCVEVDGTDTGGVDPDSPDAGDTFHYLIRVENDCPGSVGSMGVDSTGIPRSGRVCP